METQNKIKQKEKMQNALALRNGKFLINLPYKSRPFKKNQTVKTSRESVCSKTPRVETHKQTELCFIEPLMCVSTTDDSPSPREDLSDYIEDASHLNARSISQ